MSVYKTVAAGNIAQQLCTCTLLSLFSTFFRDTVNVIIFAAFMCSVCCVNRTNSYWLCKWWFRRARCTVTVAAVNLCPRLTIHFRIISSGFLLFWLDIASLPSVSHTEPPRSHKFVCSPQQYSLFWFAWAAVLIYNIVNICASTLGEILLASPPSCSR